VEQLGFDEMLQHTLVALISMDCQPSKPELQPTPFWAKLFAAFCGFTPRATNSAGFVSIVGVRVP
jgi:hypothetical protein